MLTTLAIILAVLTFASLASTVRNEGKPSLKNGKLTAWGKTQVGLGLITALCTIAAILKNAGDESAELEAQVSFRSALAPQAETMNDATQELRRNVELISEIRFIVELSSEFLKNPEPFKTQIDFLRDNRFALQITASPIIPGVIVKCCVLRNSIRRQFHPA